MKWSLQNYGFPFVMKTCYRILNSIFVRRAIVPMLLCALCAVAGGQGSARKPTPMMLRDKPVSEALQKLKEIKDLDQRVDAITKLMKEHPLFFKESGDGNLPINMAYVVQDYIEANQDKHDKLRVKLSAVDNAFAPDNSLGKSLYETTAAGILFKHGTALEYA